MENFLQQMAELLDTEADIKIDSSLLEIEEWDSLSIVSFAAMADIQYGKKITVSNIKKAKTVRDLFALVSDEK